MSVTLYSTGCPKCKVLTMKLDKKNVQYDKSDDFSALIEKGYKTAPLLEVDGEVMDFNKAVNWVNNLE